MVRIIEGWPGNEVCSNASTAAPRGDGARPAAPVAAANWSFEVNCNRIDIDPKGAAAYGRCMLPNGA